MRLAITLLLGISLSSCAMQNEVQRFSVDYNTAVSSMSNQLTLLNIVRAKEGLPTYYTSISRLTGSISVQAGGGFSAQLKAAAPTTTDSTTTQTAANDGTTVTNTTGSTSSVTTTTAATNSVANAAGTSASLANATASAGSNTVTNLAQTAIARGGNIYTPSISGQVTTGPSFDIDILDTQEFYQGVLAQIPSDTVATYLDQGFDQQLLARLLIQRIIFRFDEKRQGVVKFGYKDGEVIYTLNNAAFGDEARKFSSVIACAQFANKIVQVKARSLAPLSRITAGTKGSSTTPLKITDLELFDDTKLKLQGVIGATPAHDSSVIIEVPASEKVVLQLDPSAPGSAKDKLEKNKAKCYEPSSIADISNHKKPVPQEEPKEPPADPIYDSWNHTLLIAGDNGEAVQVPVKMDAILRSPEGVIQFLGRYLRMSEEDSGETYGITLTEYANGVSTPVARPLFSVHADHSSQALVSVSVGVPNKWYSITNDENMRENMTVLGLVEQLIDLQKSAQTRLATQPVQVVP